MKTKKRDAKDKTVAANLLEEPKNKKGKSKSKAKLIQEQEADVSMDVDNLVENIEELPKPKKNKKPRKKNAEAIDTNGLPNVDSENNITDAAPSRSKVAKANRDETIGGFKKMSDNERSQALDYLKAGYTQLQVATKFGVAASSISRLQKTFLETGTVTRKRRSNTGITEPEERKEADENINHKSLDDFTGEPFAAKGKKGSKRKRKPSAVIEENEHNLDDEHLLNDDMIEHALETESDEEDISPLLLQAHPDQHHDELSTTITMPEKDLSELFRRMEVAIPEKDTLAYSTRTEKLNWDSIAFNEYSPEECKNTWVLVQKRLRKFRLLSEVLHDAKEWISKPWTDFYRGSKNKRHPEFPKRPLSRYMIYYMKKKDKILKEHPKMEMTEISKMIAKMYKNLPRVKQEKYTKLASQYREDYDKKLEAFYQLHPELKLIEKASHSKVIETGPKKPQTPFGLFYLSQLKSVENTNVDKNAFKEKCKEQWKTLSDKKKVVWINWAEEEETKYQNQVKHYLMQNPDFVPATSKSVLTKEEKLIKERMAGKPIKPPSSAYSLFSQIMLQSDEIKKVSPKERMNVIATNWKSCSDEEKKMYKERVQHLMEQYKLDFASYLESLSEEKRQEELMNIQPKRKAKANDLEESPSKKAKTKAAKQPEPTVTSSVEDNVPNVSELPPTEPVEDRLESPKKKSKRGQGPKNARENSSSPKSSVATKNSVAKNSVAKNAATKNTVTKSSGTKNSGKNSSKTPVKSSAASKTSEDSPTSPRQSQDNSISEDEESSTVKEESFIKNEEDNEDDDGDVFRLEPKQPPKTAFAYFVIKSKPKDKDKDKDPQDIWDNFSKVTKRKYEKELDELKHAYLVEFEKFLKTMSKPRLKRYIKMKADQEAIETANDQNESANNDDSDIKAEADSTDQ